MTLNIEYKPLQELIPYARNARTHSQDQVKQIAASIREFGFCNPILISTGSDIVAGHGRALAASLLGMETVPTITLGHLSDTQRRAYVLADNRLAELSGWDAEILSLEVEDLKSLDYDLDITGFNDDDLSSIFEDLPNEDEKEDGPYTQKIEAPVYTPKGDKPKEVDLYDLEKSAQLIAEIDKSDLPEQVREFLKAAAYRHTVFDYQAIAEYYAHADKSVQDLMEKSALVIIDFDKAIEYGFVKLTKDMAEAEGKRHAE